MPRPLSWMELAYSFLQQEGKWRAVAFRALRGEISADRLLGYAKELRETAAEVEESVRQRVSSETALDSAPAGEGALLRPEVVDSLNSIHVLSGSGAVAMLENTRTAADLHELLKRTAFSLAEAAKLAMDNAQDLDRSRESAPGDPHPPGGQHDQR
ncbi:hypothetical protein [Sciscionella marina]|uniref:hypothetical protein n=1 Tax=Sciscionella marina TaxID=508770 RepID=UPI0003AAF989|nr:hypothetical protein [Sciscionella marina]